MMKIYVFITSVLCASALIGDGSAGRIRAHALIKDGKDYQLGRNNKPIDHGKAVDLYRKAYELDRLNASFYLAHCYYEGLGVRSDKLLAINYLKESATAGKVWAKADLANCYFFGDGVDCDKRRTVEILKDELAIGSRLSWRSKMNLGLCYLYGLGTEQDIAKGYKIIDDAERAGGDSCNRAWCAYLHYKGIGCSQDRSIARYLLKGSTKFLLTRMSHDEREYFGVAQWFDERPFVSIEKPLLEMASDGCGEAMVNLSLRYFSGSFVRKDYELSLKWLLEAVDVPDSGYVDIVDSLMRSESFVAMTNAKRWAEDSRVRNLISRYNLQNINESNFKEKGK